MTSSVRSRDPIANLQITIRVIRTSSPEGPTEAGQAFARDGEFPTASPDALHASIKWQQKIFSKEEITRLRGNAQTDLEKEYQQRIRAADAANLDLSGANIHTMVEGDKYFDQADASANLTTSASGVSALATSVVQARQNFDGGLVEPCQPMFVLFTPPQTGLDDVVLARLRAYSGGRLEMKPSFNVKTTIAVGNNTYLYWVENASAGSGAKEEADAEEKLRKKNLERQLHLREHLTGTVFVPAPTGGNLRLFLFGEITSVKGIWSDSLYVRYQLEAGEGWSVAPQQNSTATTQLTFGKTVSEAGAATRIHHFAFPISFEGVWSCPSPGTVVTLPTIYVEVNSCDFWDRRRVEGYGNISVPQLPGSHALSVPLWRPVRSVFDELQSFFIGGGAELNDLTYAGIPTGHENFQPLNKYGLQSESNGELELRLHIATQSSVVASARPHQAQRSKHARSRKTNIRLSKKDH